MSHRKAHFHRVFPLNRETSDSACTRLAGATPEAVWLQARIARCTMPHLKSKPGQAQKHFWLKFPAALLANAKVCKYPT
ncbi:MAG: hypothetical protein WDA70_13170, partial [Lysobacteraceae bacterium]